MTFSYTDDAIVSTSPTGRHLSTVIKRPCVLMSSWNEHAEEICKALSSLQPADAIGYTVKVSTIHGEELRSATVAEAVALLTDVIAQRNAQLSDLEKRACKAFGAPYTSREWVLEPRTAEAFKDPYDMGAPEKAEPEVTAPSDDPQSLKIWQDYGHRIYAHAVEQGKVRDTLAERVKELSAELARAHEQLKAPVELNGERLAALASMKPGAFLYTVGGAARAIKRV